MPALEAAHIKPYAAGGQHLVSNGLLLRRDLHRLYDLGYVTVTPEYVFSVGNRLREEFKNGRSYYGLDGTEVVVPSCETLRPHKELLEWHRQTIFRG
jgi:putative restriction endonuclease